LRVNKYTRRCRAARGWSRDLRADSEPDLDKAIEIAGGVYDDVRDRVTTPISPNLSRSRLGLPALA